MKKQLNDTIAAISTPRGKGGVGVIRVSGEDSEYIAQKILKVIPKPRIVHIGSFYNLNDEVLDHGIALFFRAPNSFTGEDVLELQGHGSPIVLDNILKSILGLGARIARPGEFSKRAFLNNKIDLSQAEAIADLIDASSDQAARLAMRSLQGEFSKRINEIVSLITDLRMYVEASIDFSDEEIDFLSEKSVIDKVCEILTSLENVMKAASQGAILREGINIVIVGKPNVGKSSLLNCLSGLDSAIVTDIAGTTRDVIRENIQIDGIPLHVFDTAGLQESDDIIEREGMKKTLKEIESADHILLMTDMLGSSLYSYIPDDLVGCVEDTKDKITLIKNKIDLTGERPDVDRENKIIYLSAKTQEGINLLKEHLKKIAGVVDQTEGLFMARRRHLDALDRAHEFLLSAREENKFKELIAEDLRQAQLALSEITGEFTTDDLLDKIFSSFCVGK